LLADLYALFSLMPFASPVGVVVKPIAEVLKGSPVIEQLCQCRNQSQRWVLEFYMAQKCSESAITLDTTLLDQIMHFLLTFSPGTSPHFPYSSI
jgi:hypothetical protein